MLTSLHKSTISERAGLRAQAAVLEQSKADVAAKLVPLTRRKEELATAQKANRDLLQRLEASSSSPTRGTQLTPAQRNERQTRRSAIWRKRIVASRPPNAQRRRTSKRRQIWLPSLRSVKRHSRYASPRRYTPPAEQLRPGSRVGGGRGLRAAARRRSKEVSRSPQPRDRRFGEGHS